MPTLDEQSTDIVQSISTGSLRRWLALWTIVIAAFMTTLDDFIVFVATPSIQRDLHANAAEIQWVIAGYVLAYGVSVVTGGRLGDIYGRKRTFLIGLCGFTFASLLCGLAPNILLLLGARIFEGIMAAIMFPQVLSLITVLFPSREQARAFGILGAVIGAAAIGGQLLGGLLLGANLWGLMWRPIFFVNVPVGILAALAALFLLQESRSTTATQVDGPGILLASTTLLLLIYPLVQGRELGWPLWIFACLAAFVIMAWLFVRYEQYRTTSIGSPLVELALFQNIVFARGMCVLLLETALGSGLFFVLALYLQAGNHFSPFKAGLAFTPMAIAYVTGSLIIAPLTRFLGTRILHTGIFIAILGILTTYTVVKNTGTTLSILSLLPLAIMGFGNALVATPLPGFLSAAAGKDAAGAAAGAIATVQQVGPALGVALIGVIFFGTLGLHPSIASYTNAFTSSLLYFLLAVSIMQLVLVIGIPPTFDEPTELSID